MVGSGQVTANDQRYMINGVSEYKWNQTALLEKMIYSVLMITNDGEMDLCNEHSIGQSIRGKHQ